MTDQATETNCDHCRQAHHSEKLKKNLIVRLNRIEGQVRGVARMIENDVYCDDVLNQISSIQSAFNGVKKQLLEAHLKSCVREQILEGGLDVIDELMLTIDKMLK
jgi:DNA-binding FrmR family transcriptional regulator